jgi:hypothetical protein
MLQAKASPLGILVRHPLHIVRDNVIMISVNNDGLFLPNKDQVSLMGKLAPFLSF